MISTYLSADRQEQKKKLLKAKIAVALHDELGRVPKEEEINQVFLPNRVIISFTPVRMLADCVGASKY